MPRPLMFSKKYLNELLSGSKLTTIRAGNVRYRPGDIVLVYCGGLVLGRARILRVERKKLIDLTEEDARRDGFSSLQELLKALKQHYPNIRRDTPLTLIEFEWVERFETPLSDTEYSWNYDREPLEVAKLALEKLNDLSFEERIVLETFVKTGSIRKAARKLGGLSTRPLVRGVLKRAAERLASMGLIGLRNSR
jgi:hypothetical protein